MRAGPSVRLRADGRWEARYIKGRNPNKSIIYGYVYASSREEVEEKRGKIVAELIRSGEAPKEIMLNATKIVNFATTSGSRLKSRRYPEPLDEETAAALETEMCLDERWFPFLCALYMGIDPTELCAIRYSDFCDGALTISEVMPSSAKSKGLIVPCAKRTIPIPDFFRNEVEKEISGKNKDAFLMTGSDSPLDRVSISTNQFRRLSQKIVGEKLDARRLRSTFICRALRASLNLETVSELTGLTKEQLKKYYGQYINCDIGKINDIYSRKSDDRKNNPEMNLLILGAGSHGHGVKETAQRLGLFRKIAFLDDISDAFEVIGKCADFASFLSDYPAAFVAIGNNDIRSRYVEALKEAGFLLPRLIHPDATVSQSAVIGDGTIVMAQATVNANAEIGNGCILATGSIVDFGAKVGSYAHIDSAAMVTRDAEVGDLETVESGEIVKKKKIS